ncbi:AT hook motif-containing protein [Trifolium repens]|nr:AT hook motif-containing protein [Trifolium repens]
MNQGSGVPSNSPMKRKRGRPRKEENNVVHGVHKPENVLYFNQPASIATNSDSGMLGKTVTGVIEASFKDGFLVNVKATDSDSFLRGVVFLPGQVNPVTAETDVAPHVQMINRKEFPIPMPNPQTSEAHGSLPSLHTMEPIPVPFSGEHVLPTEVHTASISVPPRISEAEHVNQLSCLNSETDCDKTVNQSDNLHELGASTQVQESNADAKPASETMNLLPTIENTDKDLTNEDHVFSSENQLNELVHNEPNSSNVELNLASVSAEPESMSSEPHIIKSVENFVEKQTLPETDEQEDENTKLISIETLSKVDDTSSSNGKPSTDIANTTLEAVPSHAVETNQSDPADSKLSSEGCEFIEKSDPQNCSSLGDVNKVDFNCPTESLVDAVPSENQIGGDT